MARIAWRTSCSAWLFSGSLDDVVKPGCVSKTWEYYEKYAPSNQITFVTSIPAAHAIVTDNWGNNCSYFGFPYINDCQYDMAGEMMNYLNGSPLKPRATMFSSNLLTFMQAPYIPLGVAPSVISMANTGFVYVPTACQNNATVCQLHVFYHGCLAGVNEAGTIVVTHAGLNEWAEANNIIVLYPQAARSDAVPYNPQGCWDWWGYTGADYATRLAPQIGSLKNMIDALSGGKFSASRSST